MTEGQATPRGGLPGNPLIWILIASEVLVFALALLAFLVMRLLHPDVFRSAAHQLHPTTGTLSMAVLLSSGYLAALALRASKRAAFGTARGHLLCAAALGLVFLLLKALEYSDLWHKGISFDGSHFFTLYALITGFHAAHVLFGCGVLLLVTLCPEPRHVDPAAAFWHMVDLVWVLVFPVVYLVPR